MQLGPDRPQTTAGGAPEPGQPGENRGRFTPASWKRGLAWGAYALAMVAVIAVLAYAFL